MSNSTRRDFVATSVAVGLATAAVPASAALETVEKNVEIKTPDGTADGYFVHPATGTHPGVLIWADAFGLRPYLKEMAKRLAGEGYSVLAPNPFYRAEKGDKGVIFQKASDVSFSNPTDAAKLRTLMGSVNAAGNPEKDAAAFIAFLDAQTQVNKQKKIGTQGYCMGGPLIMRTAATVPARVGAAASFHGGGLATATPTSPHLLIPKMKSQMLIAIAANDDAQDPAAKDTLKKAFADAKITAEIEVYTGAQHGWCMGDSAQYNKEAADKAWSRLLALYKTALA